MFTFNKTSITITMIILRIKGNALIRYIVIPVDNIAFMEASEHNPWEQTNIGLKSSDKIIIVDEPLNDIIKKIEGEKNDN